MNSKLFPAMKYITTHWRHDLNLTHLKCSDYDKGFIRVSNVHLAGWMVFSVKFVKIIIVKLFA